MEKNVRNHAPVRGERRAERLRKKMTAPRGGTRGSQALHTQTRRGYAGLPASLKPRVAPPAIQQAR